MYHPGILMDHETPDPVQPPQSIVGAYDEIQQEASRFISKYLDSSAPYQECYPAPIKEIDGKRFSVYSCLCATHARLPSLVEYISYAEEGS
jgi:hypothetical protein